MRFPSSIRPFDPGRRRLLRWLAAGPAVFAAGGSLAKAASSSIPLPGADLLAPRSLSMVSTHTGESLEVRYFEQGQYLPEGLQKLDRLLRDHRSGEVAAIDPKLFDQLHALALCAGCVPHFEIISGYRSPATNEKLRKTGGGGVAKRSLHMDGRAIDVRLAGCRLSQLRDLALAMNAGGVGYYPTSAFVHLDTGRVRSWSG